MNYDYLIKSRLDSFLSESSSFNNEEREGLFQEVMENLHRVGESSPSLRDAVVAFLSHKDVNELYEAPHMLVRTEAVLKNQLVIPIRSGIHKLSLVQLALLNGSFGLFKDLIDLTSKEKYSDNMEVDELVEAVSRSMEYGYSNSARFLFETRSSDPEFDYFCLCEAAKYGSKELVQYFVEQKNISIDPDDSFYQCETPLKKAVVAGYPEIVQYFIDKGVALEFQDTSQSTALHHAASSGHLSIFKMLKEAGASLSARNSELKTPLDLAVLGGHGYILSYLIQAGVQVTAQQMQTYINIKKDISFGEDPSSDFGVIIDDLRQVLGGEETYKLTPEVKGSVSEDQDIQGVMHISRQPIGSFYQYIFEMVLGLNALANESEILHAINNGKNHFSNPASQLAHAVSGMTFHVEIAGKNKDLFGYGPQLLLEAYALAKEKEDLDNFFKTAFNKNNVCIDARLNLLSDYIERNRLGFDPELEVEQQRDVVRQLYDYLRVFTNLQVREASNQLGLDYKEAKDAINQETATEELKAAYQELFTFERFKDFVSENPEHLRHFGVEEIDYKAYSFAEEHFTS